MGKLRIKLLPNGMIEMVTEGIKGKKCVSYAKLLQLLTDAKIDKAYKTKEYDESEYLELDESQRLRDN